MAPAQAMGGSFNRSEKAIGPLREVHNWTNRPVWPQYTEIPTDRPPVPKGLDWSLWLGPAIDRPYHPHYTHTVFRGWYDFGGGSMADMGIYSLWPVFAGLELGVPVSARPGPPTPAPSPTISAEQYRTISPIPPPATSASASRRPDMPELDLFWYDGGMKPRLPAEVEAHTTEMAREGILFVGDEGVIMAGFHGQSPQLFVKGQCKPLPLDEEQANSAGRHGSWFDAVHGGAPSPGDFHNAAAITDAVNLGTVALRAGRKVLFDSEAMKITNAPDANRYLVREYRPGWEM